MYFGVRQFAMLRIMLQRILAEGMKAFALGSPSKHFEYKY
jgi:hypothetical protein